MGNRTYWEEQAIKKMARELEMENFNMELNGIENRIKAGLLPKEALDEFLLSEKPMIGCIIYDPGHIMSRPYIEKD